MAWWAGSNLDPVATKQRLRPLGHAPVLKFTSEKFALVISATKIKQKAQEGPFSV